MEDNTRLELDVFEQCLEDVRDVSGDMVENAFITYVDGCWKDELKNLGFNAKTVANMCENIWNGDWSNEPITSRLNLIIGAIDNSPDYLFKTIRESDSYRGFKLFKDNWTSYGTHLYKIHKNLDIIREKHMDENGVLKGIDTELISAFEDSVSEFGSIIDNLAGIIPGGEIIAPIFSAAFKSVSYGFEVIKGKVESLVYNDLCAASEGHIESFAWGENYTDKLEEISPGNPFTPDYLFNKILTTDYPEHDWQYGPGIANGELSCILEYCNDNTRDYFNPYIEWRMLYELNQVVMAETGIDLFEDNRTFKQKLSDAWSQDGLVDSVVDCLSLVGSQANQNSKEAREIIEDAVVGKLEKWGVTDWAVKHLANYCERNENISKSVSDWLSSRIDDVKLKQDYFNSVVYADDGATGFLAMWKLGWDDFVDNWKLGWGISSGKSVSDEYQSAKDATVYVDPLIIDTDNDGFNINSKADGAYFDLNSDGYAEKINWTNKDSILAMDINKNGTIDNGREVFGDYHIIRETGERAKNGFEALKQYDSNNDGVIDSSDEAYNDLLLWKDTNNNGVSETDELTRLSDSGIKSISLDYENSDLRTGSEAVIGNASEVAFDDETASNAKIGELWVASDLFDTIEEFISGHEELVDGLPNVRNYGKVSSLHNAIKSDETGALRELVTSFTDAPNRTERLGYVESILNFICKTDEVADDSRGGIFSAKKLHIIEQFMGEEFVGTTGSVPNSSAVPILESVYSHIVEMYYNAMIGSKLSKYLDDIAIKIDEDNNIYFNTSLLKAHLLVLREFEMYDADEVAELCSYLHYFGGAVQNDFELYSRVRNLAISIYPADKELFDDYISDSFIGGVENDTIWGSDSANTLFGKSGDDVIYAYGGNDALEGGKGDDTLYGGYGDDTYIFNIGDGADVINEQEAGSTADRILFGEGISPEDITVARDGDDMILHIGDNGDSIRIVWNYAYKDYQIEKFEFADGTVITNEELLETPLVIRGEGTVSDYDYGYGTRGNKLVGSESDDTMYAYSGDDALEGGKGDDTLYGGYGDDTYIFNIGDGADVINEQEAGSTADRILFGEGISPEDITVARDGDDMILHIGDNGDSIRIVWNYAYKDYQIEKFEFADGTVAHIDLGTSEFVIDVQGAVAEVEQTFTEYLSNLYSDEMFGGELTVENTVISDVNDSVSIGEESNDISDIANIQAMVLAENMSAFSNDSQVSDGINISDITADASGLEQLLVSSSVQ